MKRAEAEALIRILLPESFYESRLLTPDPACLINAFRVFDAIREASDPPITPEEFNAIADTVDPPRDKV